MILAAIKGIAVTYLRQILAGVAIAAALYAMWGTIYTSGRKAEKVDGLVKQVKTIGKVHEIQDKNRATLRDGDAVGRLRESWSRD